MPATNFMNEATIDRFDAHPHRGAGEHRRCAAPRRAGGGHRQPEYLVTMSTAPSATHPQRRRAWPDAMTIRVFIDAPCAQSAAGLALGPARQRGLKPQDAYTCLQLTELIAAWCRRMDGFDAALALRYGHFSQPSPSHHRPAQSRAFVPGISVDTVTADDSPRCTTDGRHRRRSGVSAARGF